MLSFDDYILIFLIIFTLLAMIFVFLNNINRNYDDHHHHHHNLQPNLKLYAGELKYDDVELYYPQNPKRDEAGNVYRDY